MHMRKKMWLLVAWTLLFLSGCAVKPAENEPLTQIRLPMGYIPNVQYAPFYVTAEKGYFAEEGLEVSFDYQNETDGVALVAANELPFSVVSAEEVPLARAQGLPVVYFLSWWQDYPVAIAVKAESEIETLADLKGKRIGLPGLYGASYIGLRALLDAAEIAESEVVLDSIGYNQVAALISGQVDAVVVYDNNEPIQLEANGYPARVFAVRDLVSLASNGILTNETVLAENPELVRSFARAFLRGLADTLSDPDAAFEISKKFIPDMKEADWPTQRKVLQASASYWQTAEPGQSYRQAWENMQTVLLEMGLLREPVDLEKAFTNDFLP